MSENLPAPSASGWLAEWAANGKIPGAVKAIARLVGASADVGTTWIGIASAKGEQLQQAIKDETTAKTAMSKALTKAAAAHAVNDAALVERAVEQWAGKRLRSQANREAIAVMTVEHLKEGEQFENTNEAPSDDWLNLFEHFAEQASSERLQDTWARVLAGEIRKPGSFSHRTLQFLSVLDQNLAIILQEVLGRVSNKKYVFIEEGSLKDEELENFSMLQDVGLIRFGNLSCTMSTLDGKIALAPLRNSAVMGLFDGERQLKIQTAILSPTAVELMSVVRPKDSEKQMKYIAHLFRQNSATTVGKVIIDKDGKFLYESFVEI